MASYIFSIKNLPFVKDTHVCTGRVSFGGGGGGVKSLTRIFSPLLARKSSCFARIVLAFWGENANITCFWGRKWQFEKCYCQSYNNFFTQNISNQQIGVMASLDFNQSVVEDSTGMTEFNLTHGFAPDPAYRPSNLMLVQIVFCFISVVVNFLNVLVTCNKSFDFPISNRVAIVSMSMADLVLGTTAIINVILLRFRVYICQLSLIIYVTCVRVSVVSLVLVIVDRYFAIAFPFRHQRYATKRVSIAVALTAWFLVAVVNVIENEVTGSYRYNPRIGSCDIALSAVRSITATTIGYVVTLTTMIIIYSRLLAIVRALARDMIRIYPMNNIPTSSTAPATAAKDPTKTKSERGAASSTHVVDDASAAHNRPERSDRDHHVTLKTIITFFSVTVAFTLSNVPLRIVRLVVLIRGYRAVFKGLAIFCRLLWMTGSLWNFIIFSLVNQNFRKILLKLFRCRRRFAM